MEFDYGQVQPRSGACCEEPAPTTAAEVRDRLGLRTIDVRYLVADIVWREPARAWTIAAVVSALEVSGVDLGPNANKYVADLLRTEMARGRVLRVGRGRYRAGFVPGATMRRIRSRCQHLEADLVERTLDAARVF